jgi:hypothetical protein
MKDHHGEKVEVLKKCDSVTAKAVYFARYVPYRTV